jgi:hypothetical protein
LPIAKRKFKLQAQVAYRSKQMKPRIQAAVTLAHGGLLFPPEIPQNSANIDLPARAPSLFPKSRCSLRSSNYKGI